MGGSWLTLNDFVTQTVTRWYGGPTPQERVRTEYSLDILHLANILQCSTNEVSFNPPAVHPSAASPVFGRIYGWVESVGATHIGKLDLGETFVNLWVPGASKEITSRISPRLTSVATLSFSHPSIVVEFPSRQWKWYRL